MKNLLKLHPHRHTGKLLHHRHTSYRALFLLLALVGAVMLTPVGMARAADYTLTAIVPAPLPPGPATITGPTNGSVVDDPTVIVRGVCPTIDPAIIVVLYEGSTVLGSQQCSSTGTFNIPVSFAPGAHTITAQIVNFTGQTGATSDPVSFTYVPKVVATPASGSGGTSPASNGSGSPTSTPSAGQLEIISDSPFIVFGRSTDAVWNGSFRGGTPPYSATVHWGDGTQHTYKNLREGQQTFRHRYTLMQTYRFKIELRDSLGRKLSQTITAVTPSVFSAYPTAPTIGNGLGKTWVYYALYILLVIGLLAIWQQERLRHVPQPVTVPVTRRRKPQTRQTRKRH